MFAATSPDGGVNHTSGGEHENLAGTGVSGASRLTDQMLSTDPIAPLRVALKGRYEIQREIGQGAFATVYLARDCRHERSVALKVLNADPTSEAGEIRFIREIRLLAGLQHPNILPLHDSGHVEALLYYVMPYVSGETLRARMSRERFLSIDAAVGIARESADALACAHGQGIIHRDIKPENILLSGGHAIVADFGIARAIDIAGVRQLTRTGMGGPGTPAYMSPEQLLGDNPLDGRSDIYSLGCVLYEMLTGKAPFAGKEGFVKRFTEPAPLASSIRKEVEPWLEAVVETALARNPADRYATAGELVRALSVYSSGEPATRSDRATPQRATPAAPERISYNTPAAASRVVREVEQASIGVLPFANMSNDPENEYFSDGITEEILNALMRIPALKVAARTSSFALKGKSLDISEIGERLKVKTVLEGSVRRVNQRVRITAQLINAADGYHLWSERYDRDVEDVFAIQDEIARTIVDRLKVKLGSAEYEALGKGQTENVEAYELYLRGRHCWNRWHLWGMMEKAMGYYEAALAKDPDYALAHHGLADAYATIGLYAFAPATEVIPKAKAAAFRAVELAPELAEAWTSLGFVHMLSWEWKEAESTLLKAIEINPRYASARTLHAWLLTILGRQSEALEEARRGQEIDPPTRSGLSALVLYHGRLYDQAIAECERGLEIDPTSFLPLVVLSLSYAGKGKYDQAVQHAERGVSLAPGSDFLRALLGAVYAMAGQEDAARGILSDLVERSTRSYVAPILISWIYANLRDPDGAFEWLGKAYDERTCTLGPGIGYAVYDGIREDPRFGELLQKLGLN
jgi:serine/threonine protein kinase/tetratricopeptide (TPR) repeat protein